MVHVQKGVVVGRGRRILGLVLAVMSIAAMFGWEKWGRDRFLYDEVVELTKNAGRGTVITRGMLRSVRVEHADPEAIRPSQMSVLVGRQTLQFVHGGAPLFQEYFGEPNTAAGKELDRYVMSVPESWYASIPESAAPGDTLYFFCDGAEVTSAVVRRIADDRKSFEVVVSKAQQEKLGRAAAAGSRFTLSYN